MSKVIENIFPLEWSLSDPLKVEQHNKKVFGTFICGGGSTMGYKLAGYDHIGGVEIIDKYVEVYNNNFKPKYLYHEDIRAFVERNDLPDELYKLDLLDGSPPCAAFSTAGSREKGWGKESRYEDIVQRKDDLTLVYCKLINKLRPKCFLLENVSGLAKGNARAYLKEIVESVSRNYRVQIFLLNAATMGIPQMRTRVFVIGINRVYEHLPKLQLDFDCPRIGFEITAPYWNDPDSGDYSIERFAIGKYWDETEIGTSHIKHFSLVKPALKKPCNTLTQTAHQLGAASVCHPIYKRKLNKNEMRLISTFPKDYNYLDCHPANIMGRSVLPVMMANISYQIYQQWLSKI